MHIFGQTLTTVDVMTNSVKPKPELVDVCGDSSKNNGADFTEIVRAKEYPRHKSDEVKVILIILNLYEHIGSLQGGRGIKPFLERPGFCFHL